MLQQALATVSGRFRSHALYALLGLISVSSAAFGAEIPMVKVTASFPAGYNGAITAVVDDGGTGITVFNYKDSRGMEKTMTVEEMREGVVLAQKGGKVILKLQAPDFSAHVGGEMILTFLKGFFGNDRREVRFEYVRNGGITEWLLQTNDAQGRDRFDLVHVFITKKLGIPTGVGSIRLNAGKDVVRKYNPNELPQPKTREELAAPAGRAFWILD